MKTEIQTVVDKLMAGKQSGEITLDEIVKQTKLQRNTVLQELRTNPAWNVVIGRRGSPTRLQFGAAVQKTPQTAATVPTRTASSYFLQIKIGEQIRRLPIAVDLVTA
jgi:hypothetical protein